MKNTNPFMILLVFMMTAFNIVRAQQESQTNGTFTEHYFYQNGEKVYYPLRPFELYVQVKSINNGRGELDTKASIVRISNLLDSLGLFISYKSYEDEALLKFEAESLNGQSAFSPYVLFVKRKDSLPFDLRNSNELKQLRLSPFVQIAGTIVLQENQERFLAFTFGRKISFIPKSGTSSEQVNDFLNSIGLQRAKANFNSVETNLEDAICIVDYVEPFIESGLFEKVEMDVYYNAFVD